MAFCYPSQFVWFRISEKERHFWLGGLTQGCSQTGPVQASRCHGSPQGLTLETSLGFLTTWRPQGGWTLTWPLKLSTGSIPRAKRKLCGLSVTEATQHHFYHSPLIRIRLLISFQGKASLLDGRMTKDFWTCFKTVTCRLGEKEM